MKTFQKLILIILANLLIISCSKNEEREIAFILKGISNPYWKVVRQGIKDTAKKNNVKIGIYSSNNDQDANNQLDICETVIQKKPKAIIFSAVNASNLLPCLHKAANHNIDLIDLDGGISEEFARENNLNILFSVGSNNYELGKKAAIYLKDNNIKGKALILEGTTGHRASKLRKNGFIENINEDIDVIASLPANWDNITAANITNDIITRHKDLDIIFAANDMMALGAAETLISKKITNISIIGIDGTVDAVRAIKEDRISASIAQLPYLIGGHALEKYLSNNKYLEYNQYIPVLTLDKEVLNSDNPLLEYVK